MDPIVVLVIVDALGYDVAARYRLLPELPVRRPLETVLGYSSAAIPSLLSGVPPSAHGHWSMYRRANGGAAFRPLAGLLKAASRLPRGRDLVRRRTARWLATRGGIRGYFSLYEVPLDLLPHFDLVEKDDLFAPGGLGAVPTLFDRLAARGVAWRAWSWRVDPGRAAAEAVDAVRDPAVRALVLYRADLDASMHAHGTESEAARATVRAIEDAVRAVRRAGEAADRAVTVLVTSDHGMVDAPALHDVQALVARTGLAVPRDVLPFYDSTMARFWFASPRARELVSDVLAGCPAGRILTDQELAGFGVRFADAAYGELVFLLAAGHQIAPSFMGRRAPRAMHGYSPEEPGMNACLLSTGGGEDARSILDVCGLTLAAVDPAGAA